MYQALYRKYRPKSFEDVYGQDVITRILINSIKNNKISHAYLFTGPRGTGKTSIAKIFAKTINCENLNDATPCNKCTSCMQINNMDIIEIDAASNNGVDEIRELREKINLVPSISKYKVYIIDEVHMLTIGAFNALLKTLEEPPQHAIFILATTEAHKIPSTILSRCQRFDFKKISNDKICELLSKIVKEEKITINENAIKEIARLSDGGLRDAISILDQVIAYSDENVTEEDIHNINGTLTQYQLKQMIQSIYEGNLEKILNEIDDYDNKGKNLIKVTEEIILFLKNILLIQNIETKEENVDNSLYIEFKCRLDNNTLYDIIVLLNDSIYKMKNSNNSRLILELLFIKIISYKNDTKNEISSVKSTQIEPPKKINIAKKSNKKEHNIDDTLMNQLKLIRINNTLCDLNKKIITEVKAKIDNLHEMMFTTSYGEYISIVLDGKIKAANNTNLIFVYEKDKMADEFNKHIDIIEKMFNELLSIDYNIIAVAGNEWDKIKDEYNSKTKKYVMIDEKDLKGQIFTKESEKNDIDNLFGEIIEYN